MLELAFTNKQQKKQHIYTEYDKFTYLKKRLGKSIFYKFRKLSPEYRRPESFDELKQSLNKLYESIFMIKSII